MSNDTLTCSYCKSTVHGKDDVWLCRCGAYCTIDTSFRWERNSAKYKELKESTKKKPKPEPIVESKPEPPLKKNKTFIKDPDSDYDYAGIPENDILYSVLESINQSARGKLSELKKITDKKKFKKKAKKFSKSIIQVIEEYS